ncbi:MAG: glycosyl hydrolase family 8 [bacterium]
MTPLKILWYLCFIASLFLFTFGVSTYFNSHATNIIFSDKAALQILWEDYKNNYLDKTTLRAIDKQSENITTSEGQSYTLLRAVWVDDEDTFSKVFAWTVVNMQHKNNHLFSWLYGDLGNGKYGVLSSKGGNNSATDADTDIALALLFGYSRWGNANYLNEAKLIINDIWQNEVITVGTTSYVVADDIEKKSFDNVLINPSYFSPYAYRIFSKVDPQHSWMSLVDSSYHVLQITSSSSLDKKTSAGLPPNWVLFNKKTGAFSPASSISGASDFSFDALRVPWRIAIDYEWFKDPRAKAYLDTLSFFSREFKSRKYLASLYSHDGTVIDISEAPAMYGGVIGYFKESDPSLAQKIYSLKLKAIFNPDSNSFTSPLSYYDANWIWFGMGLYTNLLPNLFSLKS